MRTDAEPFLQRIRAFPDDDVHRLIFADWLEEQGGAEAERAAFIRIQIALAGLAADDPHRAGLAAAERALLERHRSEWEAPFRGLATGLVFRRGFIDEVKVAARQYLRHADELFATGPIRHIEIVAVCCGSAPRLVEAGVRHVMAVGKEDRAAVRQHDRYAMLVVRPLLLNFETVTAASGRGANEDRDFGACRRRIDRRPARLLEVEPAIKIVLLEEWQQQRAPAEPGGPDPDVVAIADPVGRALGMGIGDDARRRESLVHALV